MFNYKIYKLFHNLNLNNYTNKILYNNKIMKLKSLTFLKAID
jgi:hypothetical protein